MVLSHIRTYYMCVFVYHPIRIFGGGWVAADKAVLHTLELLYFKKLFLFCLFLNEWKLIKTEWLKNVAYLLILWCDLWWWICTYNVSFYPFDILPCGTKLGCFFMFTVKHKENQTFFAPHELRTKANRRIWQPLQYFSNIFSRVHKEFIVGTKITIFWHTFLFGVSSEWFHLNKSPAEQCLVWLDDA